MQVGASEGAAQNAQAYAGGGSGLPDPLGRNVTQKFNRQTGGLKTLGE